MALLYNSESDELSANVSSSPPKSVYKDPDDGHQRFLLELEFVQCLANPTYIHCIHIVSIKLRSELRNSLGHF
nr:mediator of RNA polymerase II transcription subunit 31 [Ipomoea batatas]